MGRYVKYIGPSHQRGITAQDWRRIGITADTVWWDARNGFAVPADQFSDDQMRKAIEPDDFFVVIGSEDRPEGATRDMTPAEYDAPRVGMIDNLDGDGEPLPESDNAPMGNSSDAPTSVTTGGGSGSDY
jgi:hypothetical protein